MSNDDCCLWWREANIPFNINGITSSFKPVYKIQREQAYRTAQICRRLLMLQGWSLSSPRNYLLTQYRRLMTHRILKPNKGRTMTGPVSCRTRITIRCAGEVREGFEWRDLRRSERRDARWCSINTRGQQRDEDKATSQHCVPLLRGWVPRVSNVGKQLYGKVVMYHRLSYHTNKTPIF